MTEEEKEAVYSAIRRVEQIEEWDERKLVLYSLDAWKHFIGHEIGHAVAAFALGGNVEWVSVDPVFLMDKGVNISKSYAQCKWSNCSSLVDQCAAGMAGEQGDLLFTGSASPSSVSSDKARIKGIVERLIINDSPNLLDAIDELNYLVDQKSDQLIEQGKAQAETMFKHPNIIQAVEKATEALKKHGSLMGGDLWKIVGEDIVAWQTAHKPVEM